MTAAPLEIGAVARELGVAPSTLRSWERRYRTVVPRRGPNGQRLYDSDQIVLLRKILAQTRRGVRAHAAHEAAIVEPLAASSLRLEPTPDAPRVARREVQRLLEQGAYSERFAFDARLVASELVKNAVVHGAGQEPIELEIALHPGSMELRVANGGSRFGLRSLRTRRRDSRGLDIVDTIADAWSIDTGPRGTAVRVRLSADRGDDV